MEDVVITRDNWTTLIDKVTEKAGRVVPVWQCLTGYYSVCVPSLITPFTAEVWDLWVATDGLKRETYESYNRIPAKIVDAIRKVRSEYERIKAAQTDGESEEITLSQIAEGRKNG